MIQYLGWAFLVFVLLGIPGYYIMKKTGFTNRLIAFTLVLTFGMIAAFPVVMFRTSTLTVILVYLVAVVALLYIFSTTVETVEVLDQPEDSTLMEHENWLLSGLANEDQTQVIDLAQQLNDSNIENPETLTQDKLDQISDSIDEETTSELGLKNDLPPDEEQIDLTDGVDGSEPDITNVGFIEEKPVEPVIVADPEKIVESTELESTLPVKEEEISVLEKPAEEPVPKTEEELLVKNTDLVEEPEEVDSELNTEEELLLESTDLFEESEEVDPGIVIEMSAEDKEQLVPDVRDESSLPEEDSYVEDQQNQETSGEIVGVEEVDDSIGLGEQDFKQPMEPLYGSSEDKRDTALESKSSPETIVASSRKDSILNEFIEQGFEAKNQGDLQNAIETFMRALDLTQSSEISYLLGTETASLYTELGHYSNAVDILKRILIVSDGRYSNRISDEIIYLETLSKVLADVGLSEVPMYMVPRAIRLRVNKILEEN
ncbi:MAG: hypothetical protein ACM3MK_06415 [Chitinophagales bacterium]